MIFTRLSIETGFDEDKFDIVYEYKTATIDLVINLTSSNMVEVINDMDSTLNAVHDSQTNINDTTGKYLDSVIGLTTSTDSNVITKRNSIMEGIISDQQELLDTSPIVSNVVKNIRTDRMCITQQAFDNFKVPCYGIEEKLKPYTINEIISYIEETADMVQQLVGCKTSEEQRDISIDFIKKHLKEVTDTGFTMVNHKEAYTKGYRTVECDLFFELNNDHDTITKVTITDYGLPGGTVSKNATNYSIRLGHTHPLIIDAQTNIFSPPDISKIAMHTAELDEDDMDRFKTMLYAEGKFWFFNKGATTEIEVIDGNGIEPEKISYKDYLIPDLSTFKHKLSNIHKLILKTSKQRIGPFINLEQIEAVIDLHEPLTDLEYLNGMNTNIKLN